MDSLTLFQFQFVPRAGIHYLYLLLSIGPGVRSVLANTLVTLTGSITQ